MFIQDDIRAMALDDFMVCPIAPWPAGVNVRMLAENGPDLARHFDLFYLTH